MARKSPARIRRDRDVGVRLDVDAGAGRYLLGQINRAGGNLGVRRRRTLKNAEIELRQLHEEGKT
jgi:hypothetical protein